MSADARVGSAKLSGQIWLAKDGRVEGRGRRVRGCIVFVPVRYGVIKVVPVEIQSITN